ncbi:hypothetical protein BS17DRAFT_778527 [Gyrodon lividus]|nr:hypothetical protein BS17DRAFT_778527 [Gyrodon lividus]
MASTPPRSYSPVLRHVTVPKPSHSLQISPNLEALLEHDELTRRNSGSPTSLYNQIPHLSTSGFAISLPPPPPRSTQAVKKTGYRDHDTVSTTTRVKEVQRKKSTNIRSDSWPDALPIFASDGVMTCQPTSTTSSRSVTPNPYLNPTPVLGTINTPDGPGVDEPLTPKQVGRSCLDEHNFESSQSTIEPRSRSTAHDSAYRSSPTLCKVEKILSKGRDSLNLFAGTAGSLKLKLDGQEPERRTYRADPVNLSVKHSAMQDKPTRQLPAVLTQRQSGQLSGFGYGDTATVQSSSRSTTQYLNTPQQTAHLAPSEGSSTRSASIYSQSSYGYNDDSSIRTYCATSLPHLPLPSMSTSQPPRLQPVKRVTGHDQPSFIDLFSLSTSNSPDETSPSCLQPPSLSIPSSNFYSSSFHNLSSTSLASMKFAPPSPSSVVGDYLPPVYSRSDSPSSTSVTLSTMVFAPPSPSTSPAFPQPVSPASSMHSLDPLEFAPPSSPGPDYLDQPPLPTASASVLERGRRRQADKRPISVSRHQIHPSLSPLPPTSNWLDANERADRIRRNRKLTQVFGRTPAAEGLPSDSDELRAFKRLPPPALASLLGTAKPKNHRHAMSVSVAVRTRGLQTEPTTPWQIDNLWSPGDRRHSIPLTPSSFTFYVDDVQNVTSANDHDGSHSPRDSQHMSPTSFIDLSDEEVMRDDGASAISFLDIPNQNRRRRLYQSSSTPSLVETLDPDEQAEADRRRKREKLAKLHRFLGSRVPPEAVTGCIVGPPLPPTVMPEKDIHENWLCGRRSDSVAPLEYFDRGKEELDDKEKALNVRRAQKMERVFGTPPPQTLFHTRQGRSTLPRSQSTSPTIPSSANPFILSLDLPSGSRNPNQSAYKGKRIHRPGTSESSRFLLPFNADSPPSPASFTGSFSESFSGYQDVLAQSPVYLNYQQSLNSLIDIIDRDDRESLVELHRFLRGDNAESPAEEETQVDVRRISTASSLKSERRHSLPTKASLTSLSSEFTMSPKPKMSEFQLRRRRAAKLTHFFGVDYRELVHDVLESIEKGVEEERRRGTLHPEEVEVLLDRVRNLRTQQDQLS